MGPSAAGVCVDINAVQSYIVPATMGGALGSVPNWCTKGPQCDRALLLLAKGFQALSRAISDCSGFI